MKAKTLVLMAALLAAPAAIMAQSSYEQVENLSVDAQNLSLDSYYQAWLSDYVTTGQNINAVSETYQQEVAKRGYPKKKTVKAKIALVEHYIELLQTQLTDSRLNKDLDTVKVNHKIAQWQDQLTGLQTLLKKI